MTPGQCLAQDEVVGRKGRCGFVFEIGSYYVTLSWHKPGRPGCMVALNSQPSTSPCFPMLGLNLCTTVPFPGSLYLSTFASFFSERRCWEETRHCFWVLGLVSHTCNPIALEAETGRLQVQTYLGLHHEICLRKKTKQWKLHLYFVRVQSLVIVPGSLL